MGYRSKVVLAITKHLVPFLQLACSKEPEAQELVFKASDTFDRDYLNEESWLLTWDCIKWYEDFKEIIAIDAFVEEAISDGFEFEIDGEIQNSSEHIRFVKVGEELNDIEVRGDGFWDIYPNTSITY